MKKKYEIPEAEELRISIEKGLLTDTIGGGGPITEDVMPYDDSFDE